MVTFSKLTQYYLKNVVDIHILTFIYNITSKNSPKEDKGRHVKSNS